MDDSDDASHAALRAKLDSVPRWYHRIEVAPGIVTPGRHDSQLALRLLDDLGLPARADGLRVLDVGCRDGFFSFEMEKRGAEVVAIDYANPTVTGFAVAAELLESRVSYRVENVYGIRPEQYGRFDMVLFLGLLYHLRNPLLALDRIRTVMSSGAMLFVESQLTDDPALLGLATPAWQFLPRASFRGDASNKWAPNVPGLAAVIEECGIEIARLKRHGERGYLRGVAVDDADLRRSAELDYSAGVWGVRK